MNNKEALSYIDNNYKELIKYLTARYAKLEVAEECIQNLRVTLLRKSEKQIDVMSGYVKRALFNEYKNFLRTNKRYYYVSDSIVQDGDDGETRNTPMDMVLIPKMEELNDAWQDHVFHQEMINLVYAEVDTLPEKQRDAIYRRVNETHKNDNTEKANYRHGVLKVKKVLEERKGL